MRYRTRSSDTVFESWNTPFHNEKTPSFSGNPELQIYKCFGCGAGGGVINFIMEIEGMEFINAIKYLANQYSIEIQIDESQSQSQTLIAQLFDLHEKTANISFGNGKIYKRCWKIKKILGLYIIIALYYTINETETKTNRKN